MTSRNGGAHNMTLHRRRILRQRFVHYSVVKLPQFGFKLRQVSEELSHANTRFE